MRTDTPNIVENEHVDPEQVAVKEQAALRAETNASLAKAGCSIQEATSTLQRRPWSTKLRIEAKTRVEEGTAAELKSQVETVFNKDKMIDVIGCTRGSRLQGSCYLLECTRLPW